MKLMMSAPFEVNGRYKGGIASIANTIAENQELLKEYGVDFLKFETCRVQRDGSVDEAISTANLKNAFLTYRDLVSEINREKPDVLYFHTSIRTALLKDLIVARHAKKKTKVPIVLHIHYAEYNKIMTGKKLLDFSILSILKKYIDKIVFFFFFFKKEFVEHGVGSSKCEVIYNFSSISCLLEEIKKSNVKREFVFIGSIDSRKGIFDLLDVVSSINEDFIMHICGNCRTKEEEELFNKVLAEKNDKIIYHGYVGAEKRKELFTNSDALILPSYAEGLPMVIMEALSTGCFIIATTVGAIPEIVGEKNGILISPGDKKALKDAIQEVISMKNDLLDSIKSVNYVESKKYTFNAFLKRITEVSRSVI